jgi:hypothetical protein
MSKKWDKWWQKKQLKETDDYPVRVQDQRPRNEQMVKSALHTEHIPSPAHARHYDASGRIKMPTASPHQMMLQIAALCRKS